MKEQESQLKDFVMVPRKIRDDYLGGKLTKNEFDVLIWIFIGTNPYNGYFSVSYEGLAQDFRGGINEVNARKIIWSLRDKQYIYFANHRGRGGSFQVYPANFRLTSGRIQTLEYFKNKELITTQTPSQTQLNTQPEHNFNVPNHNFGELKKSVIKDFPKRQITTPYNDNDNKNNKYNIDSNFLKINNRSSSAYRENKMIPVDGFLKRCKSDLEERCWNIAKELGETDMRFLLSCLREYGINHIERAWGIFREQNKKEIKDPRKYFNKLIRNLYNDT